MSVNLHVEVLELKPHWTEGHRLRASLGRLSIRGNRDLTHSRAAEATHLTGGVGPREPVRFVRAASPLLCRSGRQYQFEAWE